MEILLRYRLALDSIAPTFEGFLSLSCPEKVGLPMVSNLGFHPYKRSYPLVSSICVAFQPRFMGSFELCGLAAFFLFSFGTFESCLDITFAFTVCSNAKISEDCMSSSAFMTLPCWHVFVCVIEIFLMEILRCCRLSLDSITRSRGTKLRQRHPSLSD